MAEDKFLQRRESRHLRATRNQKATSTNICGGDAAEDGRPPSMRMKILVKKEDLKQVLEAIRDVRRASAGTTSFEQRLNWMRRRQILRAVSQVKGKSRLGGWSPVLYSIPEEL